MANNSSQDPAFKHSLAYSRFHSLLVTLSNIDYQTPRADFEQACRDRISPPHSFYFFWKESNKPGHLHRGRVKIGFDHASDQLRATDELAGFTFGGRLIEVDGGKCWPYSSESKED